VIYSAYLHGRLEEFDSLTKVSFGSEAVGHERPLLADSVEKAVLA